MSSSVNQIGQLVFIEQMDFSHSPETNVSGSTATFLPTVNI